MSSELMHLLEREARAEKDEALEEARRRAAEIVAAATREAEELLTETGRRLETERLQSRTRAASAASLRAAALLLEAKDQAIQEVFARAAEELKRATADPARRRAILRRLLEEAAQGITTPGATVEASPADVDVVRDAARALGLGVEVREHPEVSGGVRITTQDRRITVENTVASRLARTRSALVSRVADILWGS